MRTVVLHCMDKGAVEVLAENILMYEPNVDGTAKYSFYCNLCLEEHSNLHATVGVANSLKFAAIVAKKVFKTNAKPVLDMFLDELDETPYIASRFIK